MFVFQAVRTSACHNTEKTSEIEWVHPKKNLYSIFHIVKEKLKTKAHEEQNST
jgi:hypothetical protein